MEANYMFKTITMLINLICFGFILFSLLKQGVPEETYVIILWILVALTFCINFIALKLYKSTRDNIQQSKKILMIISILLNLISLGYIMLITINEPDTSFIQWIFAFFVFSFPFFINLIALQFHKPITDKITLLIGFFGRFLKIKKLEQELKLKELEKKNQEK